MRSVAPLGAQHRSYRRAAPPTATRSDAAQRRTKRRCRDAARRGAAPSFAAAPAAQHFQSKLAKVKEGEPTAPRVYVHYCHNLLQDTKHLNFFEGQ